MKALVDEEENEKENNEWSNSKTDLVDDNDKEVETDNCPICFCKSADVRPLLHVEIGNIGDVSSHKMCGKCREKWVRCGRPHNCPFCKRAVYVEYT